MFYVNDDPEGKFLYTETIKLYCILMYLYIHMHSTTKHILMHA